MIYHLTYNNKFNKHKLNNEVYIILQSKYKSNIYVKFISHFRWSVKIEYLY